MEQEIKPIYNYKETKNPYSNGEEISVERIKYDNGEEYFRVFISNDNFDGCGIFLSIEQAKEISNLILSNTNG